MKQMNCPPEQLNLIHNMQHVTGNRYCVLHVAYQILNTILLLTLLTILLPFPVAAQAPDAEVDFFIKSSDGDKALTVGDQITLRLETTHPADSRVVLPQLEEQWQAFEVISQSPPEIVDNGDGTATTGKDIVVTLFRPGQYQTPKLIVTHRQADGSVEELAAPVIPINITTVLTEDTELRDLKPQAELPIPPIWPWVVAGLLLAILAMGLLAGAALWLYHRWQKRVIPEPEPVLVIDTRPPEVVAHAELDRIEALNLPAYNRIKEHYTLVATCLRRYIEGRYQIPALEQTTSELRNAFRKSSSVSMQDISGFMSILSESDLVKFARYTPQADDINGLVNKARVVVDTTTPQPEPELATTPEEVVP